MALRTETCVSELRHFFEYSAVGVDVVADGLQEVPFGEFLVERGALTRYQLLRALMMQDRYPGVRIGECAAALGFLQIGEVEQHYLAWRGLSTVFLGEVCHQSSFGEVCHQTSPRRGQVPDGSPVFFGEVCHQLTIDHISARLGNFGPKPLI